jgi:hypothetical protein
MISVLLHSALPEKFLSQIVEMTSLMALGSEACNE